jgi:hypothetical protein
MIDDDDEDVGAWTPMGIALFNWRMWRLMSDQARVLWLGLYASGAARRCPPGLFEGGPASMSEASEQSVGVVVAALAELIKIGAVEHDPDLKLTRLVELPDRLLRPHNPNMIRGWWTMWRKLPRCGLTNRHVSLLRWLAGSQIAKKEKSAAAWSSTFGTLGDAIAGPHPVNGSPNGSRNGSGNGSPNGPYPDHDLGSGEGEQTQPRGALQTTSRACAGADAGPPVVDDPGLAPVVQLAHEAFAAFERTKRAGAR